MRIAAILFVVVLLLAGCSGKGNDNSGSSSQGGSGSSGDSHSTTSGETTSGGTTSGGTTSGGTTSGGENHDPMAALSVDVASGAVPLSVNFTVTASDPDAGDSVTWKLTFGDSATAATGTASGKAAHKYATAGNYTATLTVTDSHGAEVTKTAFVSVVTAGFTPLVLSTTASAFCQQCFFTGTANGAPSCVGFAAPSQQNGNDCVWFPLPANTIGRSWVASSAGAAANNDSGLFFLDGCGGSAAAKEWDDNLGQGKDEVGTVPVGAACVLLYENNDVNNILTITIS